MKKIFLLLFIGVFLFSCDSNDPIPNNAEPILLRAALEKRVAQDNEFAFDFFKKTLALSKESNVFVSPLSVSIALGMAWNGANGVTKTEMESTLKMSGLTPDEINEYYKIMQTSLPNVDPTTKLSIANSLWYRTGFPVKSDFLKVNSDNFGAYIKELDFSKSWALDTINNWCSLKTNKLIPTILTEISPDAMMYLINAVYFKGIWQNKFDKADTHERDFRDENNQNVKVNMMYQKDTLSYYADEQAQYVDLPYGNKAFSMTVVLPNEGKTTTDVLNNMNVENWSSLIGKFSTQEIMLYLPRFKTENKFDLIPVLESMGMNQAFTVFADFSNISEIKLFISQVIHKTYVAVDEDGTEAAAVTAIGFETTSMPNYPVVNVNKPFLFIIHEKSTGVILFIGKIGHAEKC